MPDIHVFPTRDGWTVAQEAGCYHTRLEAEQAARRITEASRGGCVIVHDAEGHVRDATMLGRGLEATRARVPADHEEGRPQT